MKNFIPDSFYIIHSCLRKVKWVGGILYTCILLFKRQDINYAKLLLKTVASALTETLCCGIIKLNTVFIQEGSLCINQWTRAM